MEITAQDNPLPRLNKGRQPPVFTQSKMTRGTQDKGLKVVMHSYYKSLLGRQYSARPQLDPNVIRLGNTLTVEQQMKLCAPFTDQKIKSAMFSIPNTKSPGPDGFNSGFFKATWPITREFVREVIQHFFSTSTMPSFLGETKLVLHPKVPNPTNAREFRPISCCNVIYKSIAKLLCVRLKEVLPSLIHQNQGACVKERELLFNILIFQDSARGYSRQGVSPRCIMKIDLQKAFDSIHGVFLRELLYHLKFPTHFTKWIMACISSVTYRLNISGQQGDSFVGGKALSKETLYPYCFLSYL